MADAFAASPSPDGPEEALAQANSDSPEQALPGSLFDGRDRPCRRKVIRVENLVQRACRCRNQCLQQFNNASGVAAIQNTRRKFQELDAGMRDLHIAWCFWERPPTDIEHPTFSGIVPDFAASDSGPDNDRDNAAILPASEDSLDKAEFPASDGSVDAEQPQRTKKRKCVSKTHLKQRSPHCLTRRFAGLPVCEKALARLYGFGTARVERVRHGRLDMRKTKHPKHKLGFSMLVKKNTKWHKIVAFFWQVYHSIAEGLPNRCVSTENPTLSSKTRLTSAVADKGRNDDEDKLNTDEDSDDQKRRHRAMALHLVSSMQIDSMVMTGPGSLEEAPRRFVPHSSPMEMYHLYRATHRATPSVASFTTFLKVYKSVFRTWLGKRKKQEFPECDGCVELRLAIQSAKDFETRQEAIQQWSQHIEDQFCDRQIRWRFDELSLRWCMANMHHANQAACASAGMSVLSLDEDGMDQVTLALESICLAAKPYVNIVTEYPSEQGEAEHEK